MQAGNDACIRFSVRNEPRLSFGFAAELFGGGNRRMHLHGQILAGVEQLGQPRESAFTGGQFAEQFIRVLLHQPAQGSTGERAIGDGTFSPRPIGNFPAFANGFAGGDVFAEQGLKALTAPYARLKDGVKGERIEHGQPSTNWPKRRYFW